MKSLWRWLALLGAAAVLLGNDGARSIVRNLLELRRADQRLTRLKQEEADVRKELKALRTDDARLERAARAELGMVRPGEIEYRFK